MAEREQTSSGLPAPKYRLGETVSVIRSGRVLRTLNPCPACSVDGGTPGRVLLRGEMYECPKCKGSAKVEEAAHGWTVHEAYTVIGCVEVRHWTPQDEDDPGREVRYMVSASSSGRSGSLFHEHEIIAGDRAAAQAECDRRNAGGDYDEVP